VASYRKALSEIYSLDRFGSRLGLQRMRAILRELGNPQESYRSVLVGGSNGKGSTVEFIGAIMKENGARTGAYFSPQIEEFPERIRINGKNAGRGEIARAYSRVAKAAKKVAADATFFEIVTAMALLIFKERKVEVAVLEVGLGGRLDATNAVEPEISAITSLSLEHTGVLGSTLERIAHEKCGIARKGKCLVAGRMERRAMEAVKRECRKRESNPIFANPENLGIKLAAPGEFQRSNAAVAAEVCRKLGAEEKAVRKGLFECAPRFRLQQRGNLILDCAHNPEAASALASEIGKMKASGKKVLLFSAMKDKEYGKVLSILKPCFDAVVLTEVGIPRGEAADRLGAGRVGVAVEKNPKKALLLAKRIAGKRGLIVVAGSIYLLSRLFGKDNIVIGQ
jgi:dihydrofolate synthase/folylpolyglutamate synthase